MRFSETTTTMSDEPGPIRLREQPENDIALMMVMTGTHPPSLPDSWPDSSIWPTVLVHIHNRVAPKIGQCNVN